MDCVNEKLEVIKKYHIVVMHHGGHSYNDISKATCFYKETISKLLNNLKEHGDVPFHERTFNRRSEALSEQEKDSI